MNMKGRTLICLCAVLLSGSVVAQTPSQLEPIIRSSVSLDAKNVAASAAQKDSFPTDYGSYDKSYSRTRFVAVQLKTLGREPASVVVETIWIGKRTAKNVRVLLQRKSETITLQPGEMKSWEANSGKVTGTDLNLAAIGYRSTSGAKIEGWVITVRDAASKQLLAVRASDAPLETLARTPGAVDALPKL